LSEGVADEHGAQNKNELGASQFVWRTLSEVFFGAHTDPGKSNPVATARQPPRVKWLRVIF
jgi:hypothetical protein